MASLKTKAEDKGDHYMVNGVKPGPHGSVRRLMFCLVRTSNEDIRQLGISFILIDMNTPGISVKPIVTLDTPAEGYQEINMVYFEDVKSRKRTWLESRARVDVRKYLLEFERGNAYSPALSGCYEPPPRQRKQPSMALVNHTLKAQNFSASLMIPKCKLPQWNIRNLEY